MSRLKYVDTAITFAEIPEMYNKIFDKPVKFEDITYRFQK